MSRFGRVPRRPDHWSSPHERARSRAAERLDAALDPSEAAWLESHLAECSACAAVAAAYDTDRFELRALRDVPIEPPRDLWARTSAGIEREARRRGRVPSRAAGTSRRRSRVPIGALSGIAVVAIVVGATALSGGWLDQPVVAPAGSAAIAAATPDLAVVTVPPAATPIAVAAGSVGWVNSLDDGAFAFNVAAVDHVCVVEDKPGCAALDDSGAKRIDLASAPRSIIGSPTDDQAVVVGSDGAGADQVVLMSLPAGRQATPEPTPEATPAETEPPSSTASPTPESTASAEPSAPASGEPSAAPTEATTTPSPSPETATPEPTAAETPVAASPSPSPLETPQATAKAIAIASGVSVVGQSAAFSADGSWFAFTAEPADGSAGPDIYVWHTGDDTATRLTDDHASVFASWSGNDVVGSRLQADDTTSEGAPAAVSFMLDPKSGKGSGEPVALWRPVVDPSGRVAIAWAGAVTTDEQGTRLAPGSGQLVITSWQPEAATAATRGKVPGIDDDIADFDVRWDESGRWLAVWTADQGDATVGRLSLFRLDRESGALERPKGAPTDVPALPGFSIADGRLAWVTPHGQDAEGSKVQVVAWSGNDVGAVESVPGEDVIVVR